MVVFQYFLHLRVTSHELIAEITGSPKSLAHARTHVCCTRGTIVAAVHASFEIAISNVGFSMAERSMGHVSSCS
jgi:hypothetical protein